MLNQAFLQPLVSVLGFTYTFFFRIEQSKDAIILLEDGSRLIGE